MEAPALPWGATSKPSPSPEQNATQTARLPAVGDRIEVKWQLEHDNGTSTSLWWGAKVETVPEHNDPEGRQLYTLRYDAYAEFPEECVQVVFLDGGFLQDDNQDVPLRWKFEGEEGEEDSDEEAEGEEDMTLGLEDIKQMEQDMTQELGMPMEQAALKQLESVPMDRQMEMMAGFRSFVDHFKVHIKERLDASDGSYTVTEDDVHNIMAQFKGARPS